MNTPDILKRILARKGEEISERQCQSSIEDLQARLRDQPAPRGFYRAIRTRMEEGQAAVIAEIKRASPSKGVLRHDFDPAAIARSYAAAGATCLSVLTDVDFFQGNDAHLAEARDACSLPVLRKDFVIDPYQVYEARAIGADCILLIVAALEDQPMQELAWLAADLGLDVLVEVHDREELERALMLRTPMIGINNRDLRSFNTDIQTTIGLLPDVFHDRTVISESGIHSPADVALLRKHGVNAYLVGEAFMSAPDPGNKLTELFDYKNA
ncbi:indole-3-glycerol phosphate synthase [Methylohalomonas lacus]|uniref:Indole-3-glycerol phosphate synthase n=1 Tax=Methylohalomonas lacus TaxID=398773 RepID=A0AAE3HJN5_9GAMM|nr:indole-3-glycerol phosphate synthase TrpC [Methylohalomonas lacus]MCS3902107.1 indole-3-glycerol phosphate synthase [Methylohalomonas lacus]